MVTTTIDLTSYTVDNTEINVQDELVSILLEIKGIYVCGEQLCMGVRLAEKIAAAKGKPFAVTVEDNELALLKGVIDRLIADGVVGGELHNTLVMRVFRAKVKA